MKVEIIAPGGYGTRADNVLHVRGSIIELDDDVALKLAGYNIVRIVKSPSPEQEVETAEAAPAPENTARRTRKPAPRRKVK